MIDPKNWQVAYAVDDTHVFVTVDGGRDLDGHHRPAEERRLQQRLDGGPDREGRTDATSTDVLLVGGDARCLPDARSLERGGTITPQTNLAWDEFGLGLPNASVSDLQYTPAVTLRRRRETGDVLTVATLGRGVYRMTDVAATNALLSVDAEDHGGNVEGELDRAAAEPEQPGVPRRADRRRRQRHAATSRRRSTGSISRAGPRRTRSRSTAGVRVTDRITVTGDATHEDRLPHGGCQGRRAGEPDRAVQHQWHGRLLRRQRAR